VAWTLVCSSNTISHGGVLTDGVVARIDYRDDCILRAEIRADGSLPVSP